MAAHNAQIYILQLPRQHSGSNEDLGAGLIIQSYPYSPGKSHLLISDELRCVAKGYT
jgi:hypothetical protein